MVEITWGMDAATIRKLASCEAGLQMLVTAMTGQEELDVCSIEERPDCMIETYRDGSQLTWSSGCVTCASSPSGERLWPY